MCVLDIDLHIKNLNSKSVLEGSDPVTNATVFGASELQGTFLGDRQSDFLRQDVQKEFLVSSWTIQESLPSHSFSQIRNSVSSFALILQNAFT